MVRLCASRPFPGSTGLLLLLASCSLPGPGHGAAATAPAPNARWTPPAPTAPPPEKPAVAELPADLAARVTRLTIGDVVDLALRNNPATAQSWANARAAAAAYGASKGAYYPTIDGSATVTRVKRAPTGGFVAVTQTTYGPSASLSWLLW